MGPAPPFNPDEKSTQGNEISLTLTNRFTNVAEESNAAIKKLFLETKRNVVTIIRIQDSNNLLEILESPVTEKDEIAFSDLIALEKSTMKSSENISASKEQLR